MPVAATVTPTDLSTYANLSRPEAVPEPVRAAETGTGGAAPAPVMSAPQFSLNRRPALELSLPLAASGGGAPVGGDAAADDLDLSSPLDVPAFLRRQN
jgi:hypothetical protein